MARNKYMPKHLKFHRLSWLERLALLFAIWFVFYPRPYTLLFTILLLMPIIGLIINGIRRPSIISLINISNSGKKVYDVADFIDVAAWAILIRVFMDFKLEDYSDLILPALVSFAFIVGLLLGTHRLIERWEKNRLWIYSMLIFNISIYGMASVVGINCVYDYSKPVIFEARVVDKDMYRGRKGRRSYYITVTPWGWNTSNDRLRVSSQKYHSLNIGDEVKIDAKKGVFNMPWYYLE
jgi:hypothetical protein